MATNPPRPITDVTLDCLPSKEGNTLRFVYRVANKSAADIYILDVLPTVGAGGAQVADINLGYAAWLNNGSATILKGIPPTPKMPVTVRLIPLGFRIAPGATAERRLDIPLPFAERNPYFGELPLKDYDQQDVGEVRFAVQFLRATVEGFGQAPSDLGENLFQVWGKHTVGQAETLVVSFPTKGLVMLRRKDDIPRPNLQ
jgi:hypothetical protein